MVNKEVTFKPTSRLRDLSTLLGHKESEGLTPVIPSPPILLPVRGPQSKCLDPTRIGDLV